MKNETNANKEMINLIKRAVKNNPRRIVANIVSISKSGMSKKIKFYVIEKNEILHITYLIAKYTGYKVDKNGNLKAGGCGIDLSCHVLEHFYNKIGLKDPKYANNYKLL